MCFVYNQCMVISMDIVKLKNMFSEGRTIFDLPLRVVYYARVSTDKDEQQHSLDNQINYFEDYINKNNNWKYCGRYVDEGISGTGVKNRTAFLLMVNDAEKNKFDLVLTKEISRFSRNTLDSIKYTQHLLKYGVGVYFQFDNINTFDSDSELRLTIMSSIAQEEVRKISDRVRFGFKNAIDNGKVLGRGNMLGYTKSNGILTVNEAESEIVRKIFNLYTQSGIGIRRIANTLKEDGFTNEQGSILSYGTVYNILTNPLYKGFYCGKKYITPDYKDKRVIRLSSDEWVIYKDANIPVIIDEEMWDEADKIIKKRGKKFKEKDYGYQNRYPFSGKIICGEHSTSYHRHVYKSNNGDKEVWNCRLYRQQGKTDGCKSPTLYSNELNEILTRIFRDIYSNSEILIKELLNGNREINNAKYEDEINGIYEKVKSLNVKKEKLLDLHMDNLISKQEFMLRNNSLNEQIEVFDENINKLKSAIEKSKTLLSRIDKFNKTIKSEYNEDMIYNNTQTAITTDKITVYKAADTHCVRLDISLKIGDKFNLSDDSISLCETGISQAQVSRLEKDALTKIKGQI